MASHYCKHRLGWHLGREGNRSHLVNFSVPSKVPLFLPNPLVSTLESGAHGNSSKSSCLCLPTVLWVATGGLARKKKKKKGYSKAESNCPTESGWEGMSRGQGRERDLSGRRSLLIGHATLEIRSFESAVGTGRADRNKG